MEHIDVVRSTPSDNVRDEPLRAQVAGIIPAAGRGRRFGADKRQALHRGKILLAHAIDALCAGGLSPVIVVLEPRSPCQALIERTGVMIAENPQPELGMLSTIRAGLLAVPEAAVAAAVLPGDHPFVPPAAVSALLDHFARTRPLLLVPRFPEGRGHPLFIHRDLFAAAAACDDRVGLRQLLKQHPVLELPLDFPGANRDVDRPPDLDDDGEATRGAESRSGQRE